jgi:hypothetical protein
MGVCDGSPVTLDSVAQTVASGMGKDELREMGRRVHPQNQPTQERTVVAGLAARVVVLLPLMEGEENIGLCVDYTWGL